MLLKIPSSFLHYTLGSENKKNIVVAVVVAIGFTSLLLEKRNKKLTIGTL